MNEYLLRHAIANVWCNPAQDRQYVYKLARLSYRYGVRGSWSVDLERYRLPTEKDYYHVYQIGRVVPKLLGITSKVNQWVSLADMANEKALFSDVYVTNGIQFPRFETFVLLTATRNLVFAVRINEKIHDLEDHELYVRFYSNAYFDSKRSDVAATRFVKVMGHRALTQAGLLKFQNDMTAEVTRLGGYPYYYVNGRFVNEISLTTAQVGDVVEMVLDSSIKKMVEFKIKDLPAFTSVLDKCRKFILHYNDANAKTIDYLDDLDIYLYKPGRVAGRFMGVYYHHNEGDWLRMLTHKDYSIPSDRLTGFVRTHTDDQRSAADPVRWPADTWTDVKELTLRLYIRNSGYDRPLVGDSHRIQELYKLPDEKIVRAMTGVDAVNPLWTAAALETCPYVRFMSADPAFVYPKTFMRPDATSEEKTKAQEFVGDVYGYHAAAQILAGTPSTVYIDQGLRYADMAYEHWENATCFEYDKNGILLGYNYHVGGRRYRTANTAATKVEAVQGRGGGSLNTVYGNGKVDLPKGYNFRLYVSSVWAGKPRGDWQDITDLANRGDWGYLDDTTEDVNWVWTADPTLWYGAVRIDDSFLLQELSFNKSAGMIRFSVASTEIHDGESVYEVMEIPFGQLDVFLNNRPLIENLDYVVQWPQVVINNLEYLNADVNTVLVRGYGFCNDKLERNPAGEVGFIEYGVLSNNQVYDIHTYKVQRVIVDGHFRDPKELVFEESLGSQTIENERNGAPYVVQTPPVIFKDVYPIDKVAREKDDLRDKQVSDYMTEYYPKRVRTNPDMIKTEYHVFSAFTNKILHDLVTGVFYPKGIEDRYSDHDIRTWCKDYEWLIPFDLCNRDYNENHVQVYPHWFGQPVGLSLVQYQFFTRVVGLYLRKRPDLAPFVFISR